MAGYIKLHRGWRDTDGLNPSTKFSDWEAWLWLLENAAWKQRSRFNSKGEEVHLERGQLHVSVRSLCTAWGWSRKRVCTFLKRIEAVSKVVTKRGQSGTILTICKYDEYQSNGDSQGDGRGTVGGQSGDTQEEGKEGKEGKNKGGYAFSGQVIRLNFADFRRWQGAFPDLDLRAHLTSRDDWLRGQDDEAKKRWFQSTSAWLAKRQQEAKTESISGVVIPI